MEVYKLLERLRREQESNTVAAQSGYFDFKYKVKKPKTAAQLESLIEELINRSGGCVSIIFTGGRQIVKQNQVRDVLGNERTLTDHKWIPGSTRKGTPDLLGVLPGGQAVAIEVKFSKSDRMSKYQIAYKEHWEKAGGLFIIAHDLDDILKVIE